MKIFYESFEMLMKRSVKIYIITKELEELEDSLRMHSEQSLEYFETIGIQPLLCTGGHHRKLAILDRKVLWEGSLNILSQAYSREIMRRIDDPNIAQETFTFLKFNQFI